MTGEKRCYWCQKPKSEHIESDVGLKCPTSFAAGEPFPEIFPGTRKELEVLVSVTDKSNEA